MLKTLSAVVLALGLGGLAFAADAPKAPSKNIQIFRDGDYIIERRPIRLTFDAKQKKAFANAGNLIHAQLDKMAPQNLLDPSGDLKAMSDAVASLDQKVDQLIQVSQKIYGEATTYGPSVFDASPTALIVFATVASDKIPIRGATAGGSFTFGAVIVPMWEKRFNINDRSEPISEGVYLDSNLVVLGALNAGGSSPNPQAQALIAGSSARVGAGFVWGQLNSASDLYGFAWGMSSTVAFGGGMNVKLLGLTNFDKKQAMSNSLLMFGLERGGLQIENHLNIGYIWDAKSIIGGGAAFIADTAARISGKQQPPAATMAVPAADK